MKIIFSRKGFDKAAGGVASPILNGHTPVSLPIPLAEGRHLDGWVRGKTALSKLIEDLARGPVKQASTFHHDPDLDESAHKRLPGWRPAFGQVGAAQSHLANEGVGVGDVFLFFGWFRRAKQKDDKWLFDEEAPSIHSLFGWLQIGEVIDVGDDGKEVARRYPWLAAHPHVEFAHAFAGKRNTVYVAADRLDLGESQLDMPGGGVFGRWSPRLQLTAPGCGRSHWQLPRWMTPTDDPTESRLTYHSKRERWSIEPKSASSRIARLETVGRGQEFVLHTRHQGEARAWLKSLFADPV